MPESLRFNSPKEHHKADACVIWCFDDRFTGLLNEFTRSEEFKHYNLVRIAGGAKSLADEGSPQRFLLTQAQKSHELHDASKVVLMVHHDCGAYGSSKAFDMDRAAEYARLKSDLEKAEVFLRAHLPALVAIEKYIADFNGLHRV